MTPVRLAVGALLLLVSGPAVAWSDEAILLAVADIPSPSAPAPAVPSPLKSPKDLKSPGKAPLLPPVGLPTAPPPDAIKPVEPQAEPGAPKTDPAAAEVDADPAYRYLAVMTGDCDGLVVADHTVPECFDKLLNVDFGNGRVAFLFTGREGDTSVITTFSGGISKQPDARAYQLAIDRISTTTIAADRPPVTVVAATEGTCTMKGDPTHEQTRFECRVQQGDARTAARFQTVGKPEVYAGVPRDSQAANDDDVATRLGAFASRDRFPRPIVY